MKRLTDEDIQIAFHEHFESCLNDINSILPSFDEWANNWKNIIESYNLNIKCVLRSIRDKRNYEEYKYIKKDSYGFCLNYFSTENFSFQSCIIINYPNGTNTIVLLDLMKKRIIVLDKENTIYENKFSNSFIRVDDCIMKDFRKEITCMSISYQIKNKSCKGLLLKESI